MGNKLNYSPTCGHVSFEILFFPDARLAFVADKNNSRTCLNWFEFVQTCLKLLKIAQSCSNWSKIIRNCSNLSKLV